MSSITPLGAVGIAAGVALVGAAGYGIYYLAKNQSSSEEQLVNKYLDTFDRSGNGNNDGKINVEFETRRREKHTDSDYVQTYDHEGNPTGGYYRYDEYWQLDSMKRMADRANRAEFSDRPADDTHVTDAELLRVIRSYDRGDGEKHPARDGKLGGKELRNFNKEVGISTTYEGRGYGWYN